MYLYDLMNTLVFLRVKMKELAVIIPVCNEGEIIEKVITEWVHVLVDLDIDYKIIVYDGKSTDNTLEVLHNIEKNNSDLIVEEMERIGHGPTVVKAYKECSKNYKWIFQVDSDNEISASEFPKFWKERNNYDLVIGKRTNRNQTISRKAMTNTSRLLLNILYGRTPSDTNCPYRLMNSNVFESFYQSMNNNLIAPNVLISAYTGFKKLNFLEIPVEYKFRQTGVVSITKLKLLKISVKAFFQTINMYFKMK